MEKFSYKVAFMNNEIQIDKAMVLYKENHIPGNSITGIGITIVKVGNAVAGQLFGGLIGAAIDQRGLNTGGELDKNITNIPDGLGQMVITYSEDGTNQKILRVPISTGDENCKRMIETTAKTFADRFVGFGEQTKVEKALKISQKGAWVILAVIFLIVGGFIAFSIISEGQF